MNRFRAPRAASRRTLGWLRQRRLAVTALVAAILLDAAAVGANQWVSQARLAVAAQRQDLSRRLGEARALAAAGAPAPPADFTHALPESVPLDGFVQTLQRSASAFNVGIANVSSEQQPGTAQALPRLVVSVTLRGPYSAIKSTLAEGLSRYPTAVLERLSMKRDSALPGSEKATIRLLLPLRPAAG